MKTEAVLHHTNGPGTGGRETSVRAGRWLADLEKALWDAGDQRRTAEALPDERTVREPGLEAGQRQGHGDPAQATSPARQAAGAGSDTASHEASNNAVTVLAILTPPSMQETAPAPNAVGDRSNLAAIGAGTFAQTSLQAVAVGATDSQRPAPTDPLPQVAVRRAAAPSFADLCEVPQPTSSQRTAPPQYATRVLRVSGDEELRVNLRDATLDAASETSVASSLFGEMRAAGMSVRRLYVNGKLFECDVEGSPAGPLSTLFPSINKE